VARAALEGRLDTAGLRATDLARARKHVEELAGIGPFSSAIIVGRGLGHTDVRFGPITELHARVGALYRLGHDADPPELAGVAEAWSPWRSWVQVYFRAVSDRLPPRRHVLGRQMVNRDEPATQPSTVAKRPVARSCENSAP
jgi:DNA-3-methyladenine glycosylase II